MDVKNFNLHGNQVRKIEKMKCGVFVFLLYPNKIIV